MSNKFYELSQPERRYRLLDADLDPEDINTYTFQGGLQPETAESMIENVVGLYSLPVGIAQHFVINDRPVLIPMVIEEPSVVAAASYMARLALPGGGFKASSDAPEMIGQMQVLDLQDVYTAQKSIMEHEQELLDAVKGQDPLLERYGGGAHAIETRVIPESSIGAFLVLHLIYDVRDVMGANAINTAVELLAPLVERLTGGRVHLRILSNLADRRLARSEVRIPVEVLAFDNFSGEQVRKGILEAYAFAAADPYRAATHNKGIMNGVDAVLMATGNDWRAVEAGAHAYAARSGTYTSLSTWSQNEAGDLVGKLEMPMAVGIVGGATRVHPTAKANLKLINPESAGELAQIIVSVGLAQNLGALRALATEGIQRGHMGLHARQVAVAAGARPDQVMVIASQMVEEKNIHISRALELLQQWRNNDS